MNLIIPGNSKMGKHVFMFNLPAKKTCTPTHWCLHGKNGKPACYALRGQCTLPNVVESAKKRYEASLSENFVSAMISEIQKKNPSYFRIHASGDFYSENYARKFIEIIHACPNTLFRTTTRRRDLKEILNEMNSMPNCIVRESLDEERKEPVMGLPFAGLSYLDIAKRESFYKCQEDCTKCQHYCWKKRDNIIFDEL